MSKLCFVNLRQLRTGILVESSWIIHVNSPWLNHMACCGAIGQQGQNILWCFINWGEADEIGETDGETEFAP